MWEVKSPRKRAVCKQLATNPQPAVITLLAPLGWYERLRKLCIPTDDRFKERVAIWWFKQKRVNLIIVVAYCYADCQAETEVARNKAIYHSIEQHLNQIPAGAQRITLIDANGHVGSVRGQQIEGTDEITRHNAAAGGCLGTTRVEQYLFVGPRGAETENLSGRAFREHLERTQMIGMNTHARNACQYAWKGHGRHARPDFIAASGEMYHRPWNTTRATRLKQLFTRFQESNYDEHIVPVLKLTVDINYTAITFERPKNYNRQELQAHLARRSPIGCHIIGQARKAIARTKEGDWHYDTIWGQLEGVVAEAIRSTMANVPKTRNNN
jgi:hypothetical protein